MAKPQPGPCATSTPRLGAHTGCVFLHPALWPEPGLKKKESSRMDSGKTGTPRTPRITCSQSHPLTPNHHIAAVLLLSPHLPFPCTMPYINKYIAFSGWSVDSSAFSHTPCCANTPTLCCPGQGLVCPLESQGPHLGPGVLVLPVGHLRRDEMTCPGVPYAHLVLPAPTLTS